MMLDSFKRADRRAATHMNIRVEESVEEHP